MLSWAKPCSALWDLRVVCTFLKKKVLPFGCSPRASCYLVQGAGGSCLEITLILRWNVSEHVPGFFIKKNSDIARSGFFLLWGLEVVCLEEVLLVTCAFSWKKVHSLSVSPEPLAIWNKKLEGLKSYVVWKLLSWRSLLSDVRFLEEKVHSLSVAPEPLAIWNKKLEGLESYVVWKFLSWRSLLSDVRFFEEKVHSLSVAPDPLAIWNKVLEGLGSELFKELKTSPVAARAYIRVLLFRKNWDAGSWHIL